MYLSDATESSVGIVTVAGAPRFKRHARRMRDGSTLLGMLMPADAFRERVYGEQGLLGESMPADFFTRRVYGEQGLKREQLGHYDLIDKFLPESMQARGIAGGLGQTAPPALPAGTQLVNPYPNGVSVAGTGPNNSATLWRVGFNPDVGLWIADSGFGVAPLYRNAAEMGQLTSAAHLIPYYRHPTLSIYGFPAYGARVLEGFVARNPPPALYPGMDLVILTADGGQQYVWYRYDGSTGYWVPAHAQGTGAPGSNIFGELLIAGAVLAAAVVTYGAAAGWFAGVLPAIGGISATGAAGFVGSAASAAGAVAKLVGGGGGSAAPAGVPVVVVPPAAIAAAPPAPAPSGTPATPGTIPISALPPVGTTLTLPGGGVGTVVNLPGGGTGVSVSTPGGDSGSPTDAAAAAGAAVPTAVAPAPGAGLQQLIGQVPTWGWVLGGGLLLALLRK